MQPTLTESISSPGHLALPFKAEAKQAECELCQGRTRGQVTLTG